MFCPNCGTELNDNAAFCPNCGAAFNAQPKPVAKVKPAGPNPFMKFLGLGAKVGMDSRRFAFAVLAAALATLAAFLMHTSLISQYEDINAREGYSMEITISSADTANDYSDFKKYVREHDVYYPQGTSQAYGGTVSAGAVVATVSTVFTLLSAAYLVLPFVLNKFMRLNITHYAVLAFFTLINIVTVLVSALGICAGAKAGAIASGSSVPVVGLSLGAWIFLLCAVSALGLLIWQGITMILKKK